MDPFQVSDDDPEEEPRKFEFVIEKHGALITKYKKYVLLENGEEIYSAILRTKNRAGVHPILPGIDLVISNYRTVFMLKSNDGRQKMHAMLEFKSAQGEGNCQRRLKLEFPGDKILPEKLESMSSIVLTEDDVHYLKCPKNVCLSPTGKSDPVLSIWCIGDHKYCISTRLRIDHHRLFGILVANDVAKIPK